ncbi:MAG TPA: hypothetical protein VD735_06830 [Candidatus Saccharimonadales bacterium]|nr:hypothetical protein [Candidatus Saccharimonadales bacterium]
MTAEQTGIVPGALDMRFADRVQETVTRRQFTRLARNLGEAGVYRQLGAEAEATPWSAYMGVMDQMNDAYVIADRELPFEPEPPANGMPTVTATIGFNSHAGRDRFHYLYETLLAGVHDPGMPRMRANETAELEIANFSHPDLCTAGRVGSALFYQQYKHLGPNLRPVFQHTVAEMKASGVVGYLPSELQDRIAMHEETVGADTLLTSGRLALLGNVVRPALAKSNRDLMMQRPRGNKPAIEEDIYFYLKDGSDSGIPVSALTVGKEVADELRYRRDQLTNPYKRRDVAGAGFALASMVTGMALTEGGSTIGGALVTVGKAIGPATIDAFADRWTRRGMAGQI